MEKRRAARSVSVPPHFKPRERSSSLRTSRPRISRCSTDVTVARSSLWWTCWEDQTHPDHYVIKTWSSCWLKSMSSKNILNTWMDKNYWPAAVMLQILLVFWFPGMWRVLDLPAGLRVSSPWLWRVLDLPAGLRVWSPQLWRVLDHPAGLKVWSPGLCRASSLNNLKSN